MIGHLNLPSSDLYTVQYGAVPYAVVSLRLFGIYHCSYRVMARVQGVEPCYLSGVFLGFQLEVRITSC